ncbi:hypothetical protein GCM10017687_19940 [Streptomyces echinatus]
MTMIASPPARRRTRLALGVCLVSFTRSGPPQRAAHVSMIDLMVYRAEGAAVRAGGDLYALRADGRTPAHHLPAVPPPCCSPRCPCWTPRSLRTVATAGNLARPGDARGAVAAARGHAHVRDRLLDRRIGRVVRAGVDDRALRPDQPAAGRPWCCGT